MNKFKTLSFLGLVFLSSGSIAQNFALQESSLDKKKNVAFFNTFNRCELMLQQKAPIGSLAFSGKATMTNSYINNTLMPKFSNNLSHFKTSSVIGIERTLGADKGKVIKVTYGILGTDQKTTTEYIQLIVIFDAKSPSPKIDDIQVKNKFDAGILSFTERELLSLRKKLTPPPPAKKK